MSKNNRSKALSKLIILAFVLFVPGFLYILVNRMGSNEYAKLPVYGEKVLSGEMKRVMGREIPDTVFHQLTPVDFINQDGQGVTFLGQDSVITVAHLFYSNDQGLSKQLVSDMEKIAQRFREISQVTFFSISVDSLDGAREMTGFLGQDISKVNPRWHAVSRPSVDIFSYSRENMLLEASPFPGEQDRFLISNHMMLIDSERRIRGFYDISLRTELDRLEDEIKVQIVEEIRNHPLKVERK